MRQISRLQLGEDEKLHEYFTRAQELMSRLSDAGEQITETLFNALIFNGLPGKYVHFVVQESFNPASTLTELRIRLQNYEETYTVVYKENNRKSIRQWQCTPEVDVTEIRKYQCNPKFVMSVEIQDILQNNATREAQQFAPNATNEVI